MAMTEVTQSVKGDSLRSWAIGRFQTISPGRVFDVVVAAVTAILFSPIILLVLAAIWLESGRPFLFWQQRIGQNGKRFWMYKFRKFSPSQTDKGCPLTLKNDWRMTRVGRFLEKSKFDELPQLWNVLRGDMTLVGPRPESPPFADCFEHEFARVLDYRPGILGPSQAFFRGESSLYPQGADPVTYYRSVLFPLKARLDLAYYPTATLASNIGWMFRCGLAIFGGRVSCPPEFRGRIGSRRLTSAPADLPIADMVSLLVAECVDNELSVTPAKLQRSGAEPAEASNVSAFPAAARATAALSGKNRAKVRTSALSSPMAIDTTQPGAVEGEKYEELRVAKSRH